jgi:hypothetical protein
MNNCTSDWARLTAKEYDTPFRVSPAYIDSIQEMNLSPPDDPIVIKYMEDSAASPVNKGMEKIIESPDEYLVTAMYTLIFVFPISPADDTWQNIARDSIFH